MPDLHSHSSAAEIQAGRVALPADLWLPPAPLGLVIFAHGLASSRHNPRHQRVATLLHEAGLATLLVDLLSPAEEPDDIANPVLRSDITLLAQRLRAATEWAGAQPELAGLPLGYFGASTGAAAAFLAAADFPERIRAIISRGGRTELADETVRRIRSPTLLIVGGADDRAIAVNLETWARLRCVKSIEIIPGAGNLFEEPGALDNVAALAANWFTTHLRA